MRTTTILCLAAPALCAGCSNGACKDEVLDRLLEDCRIVVGLPAPFRCAELMGAPIGEEAQMSALQNHHRDICEVSDPEADVECLKTASCESIVQGGCDDSPPAEASEARRSCVAACLASITTCQEGCMKAASFDACLSCDVDCNSAFVDCRDDCPSP